MAEKNRFSDAAPVLLSGAAGAVTGHFLGKGKNLIAGGLLLVFADDIAKKIPKVTATNLRVAGAACMVVTPAAPSGSNQSITDMGKDGLSRIKGFANALVAGTGVKSVPFASAPIMTIPAQVEGYGYIGETEYDPGYEYDMLPAGQYSGYEGDMMSFDPEAGR